MESGCSSPVGGEDCLGGCEQWGLREYSRVPNWQELCYGRIVPTFRAGVPVDLGLLGISLRHKCLSGWLPWGPMQARSEVFLVSPGGLWWVPQNGLELGLHLPDSKPIAAGYNRFHVARWAFCGQA